MRYEFSEVLNDLVDYFILGDIQLLQRYKEEHDLPDDLAGAFTSSDVGDQAVFDGIVLPLAGVENLPTGSSSASTRPPPPCSPPAVA